MTVTVSQSQKGYKCIIKSRRNQHFGHSLSKQELFGMKRAFQILEGSRSNLRSVRVSDPTEKELLCRQLITHSRDRLDDQRVCRVCLDLAAQAIDHVLQHGVIGFGSIAPHPLVELLDGHNLTGSIHQII